MDQLQIRLANENDALDIVPLKQADDSECTGQPLSEDAALEKITDLIERHYDFWIAILNNQPVGYAVGHTANNDEYRSYGIFVSRDQRRQGIGSQLKSAQVEFARKLGCKEIWSNVSAGNIPSIGLQRKSGFEFEPSGNGYIVRRTLT